MFSRNLKYLRNKNKLSQHQLSELINYNQATIARWENNDRQPTLEAIIKVANYFKIDIGDLLTVNLEKANIPINSWTIDNNIEIKIRGKMSKKSIGKVNQILNNEIQKQNIQK